MDMKFLDGAAEDDILEFSSRATPLIVWKVRII
jgi:hypothetical protein